MAGIDEYSTTAGSNVAINSIDIAENCLPSGMNNAFRQMMADVRRFANDIGAKAVSSGTDTVTLTTETGLTAYADGTLLSFIAGGTNTGAATLNVDGVGAKAIRKGGDVALAAGDITAGMLCVVAYDASANSAAGAWLLAATNAAFQPLDSDLTTIGGLSPSNDDIIQRKAGAWTNRTIAQIKTDLALQDAIEFVIGGSAIAITTGVKGDLEIPFACTITGVTLLGDQSGSIVVNVWKDTYANYPPTVADKITASAPPTISTATKSQDTTLTGWTTSIAAGDILRFNVDSVTSLTRCTISLMVTRT